MGQLVAISFFMVSTFCLYLYTSRRNLSTDGLLITAFFAGLGWLVIYAIDGS